MDPDYFKSHVRASCPCPVAVATTGPIISHTSSPYLQVDAAWHSRPHKLEHQEGFFFDWRCHQGAINGLSVSFQNWWGCAGPSLVHRIQQCVSTCHCGDTCGIFGILWIPPWWTTACNIPRGCQRKLCHTFLLLVKGGTGNSRQFWQQDWCSFSHFSSVDSWFQFLFNFPSIKLTVSSNDI